MSDDSNKAHDDSAEVERVYEISKLLNEPAVTPEAEDALIEELTSVGRRGNKANRLAAQVMSQQLTRTPRAADRVVDALFDLCESTDSDLRVCAAKALTPVARASPDHAPRITSVLVQLLGSAVVAALLSTVREGDDVQRARAADYFAKNIRALAGASGSDSEKLVCEALRSSASSPDASPEEFRMALGTLESLLPYAPSAGKGAELVALVAAQMKAGGTSESAADAAARTSSCLAIAARICVAHKLGVGAASELLDPVCANAAALLAPAAEGVRDSDRLGLVRALADLADTATMVDARTLMPHALALLYWAVPLPQKADEKKPQQEAAAASEQPAPTATAAAAAPDAVQVNWSLVEALLVLFCKLALRAPAQLRGLCGVEVVTAQPEEMAVAVDATAAQRFAELLKEISNSSKSRVTVDDLKPSWHAAPEQKKRETSAGTQQQAQPQQKRQRTASPGANDAPAAAQQKKRKHRGGKGSKQRRDAMRK
eukprot:m51a1_g13876 hypothetical protein (488) ;mRNA; r:640325-642431